MFGPANADTDRGGEEAPVQAVAVSADETAARASDPLLLAEAEGIVLKRS